MKREAFIILSLSAIALAIDGLIWVSRFSAAPDGHIFIPIHNSLAEYTRSITWISYVFGLPHAHAVYHISRYLLGGIWCMTIYWFIETVVREKWTRIYTFAVALLTTGIALAPDILTGYIMSIAAITSIIHFRDKPSRKWIFRSVVSASIAIAIHPQGILLMIAGLSIVIFWKRLGSVSGNIILGAYIILMMFGKITEPYPASAFAYPSRDYVRAVQSIPAISKSSDVVLAQSGIIPLLIDRSVYFGLGSETLYSGDMDMCSAYTFLQTNRIGVVLSKRAITVYPFLQPWNTYGETTVYSVVNSPPDGCAGS